MMDRIAIGGVEADLDAAGVARIRALIALLRARLPALITLS